MFTLGENDYKYVIQDFSNYYMGARSSYQELADSDNTPSRFKDAIYRVFLKEITPETTVGEHLLSLKEDSLCYLAYTQLRIQIKVVLPITQKTKKGTFKETFETKDYSMKQFYEEFLPAHEGEEYLIQEISFKKRHLMMMHV